MTSPAPLEEDGNIVAAKRRLDLAISALIDSKPTTRLLEDGHTRIEWLDPLYTQLVEAIPGEKKHRTGVSTSQPPLWIDASDLLHKINTVVVSWEKHWPIPLPSLWPWAYDDEYPTIQRLRLLNRRRWRPQDTSMVDSYAAMLESWAEKITDLLADTPKLTLPNPCPNCGTAIVYRHDSAGDLVRRPALQIGAHGCECQNCRYMWAPEFFVHLARVLGYELSQGILE